MAKITFDGFDNYRAIMQNLEGKELSIIKPAVYNGAAVVIDEVKRSLRSVVSGEATGDLEASIGLSHMEDKNGYINTKLGFDGYDRKGSPNIVKARVLESGTSKQQQRKKPFIRPALRRCRERAIAEMELTVDSQIKKMMNERG